MPLPVRRQAIAIFALSAVGAVGCTTGSNSTAATSTPAKGSPSAGTSGGATTTAKGVAHVIDDACTLASVTEVAAVYGQTPTQVIKPQAQTGPLRVCHWDTDARSLLNIELSQENARSGYDTLEPANPHARFGVVTIPGADQAKLVDEGPTIEIVALKGGSLLHAVFNPSDRASVGDDKARSLVLMMLTKL